MDSPGISTIILLHIPGIWENETTKDRWHFKPLKNDGYNAMEIIQVGTGARFIYAYKPFIENKTCYIDLDENIFEVKEFKVDPAIMILINPAGKQIVLHKIS